MPAQASVFFGDVVNTWSCLKAARAHQLIAPQLLALDLIRQRQVNGTLGSKNKALLRCPTEVFDLIKAELPALGISLVLRAWTEEYANWVTDNWKPPERQDDDEDDEFGYYENSKSRQEGRKARAKEDKSACMKAAKRIATSKDWEEWSFRTEFLRYGEECVEWNDIHSGAHCANMLLDNTSRDEINVFLANFGLQIVGGSFHKNGENRRTCVSDVRVSISNQLAHPNNDGIKINTQYDKEVAGNVINLSFPNIEAVNKSFRILCERYQVEFAQSEDGGFIDPQGGAGGKKKGKSGSKSGKKMKRVLPTPSWKLYCGMDLSL